MTSQLPLAHHAAYRRFSAWRAASSVRSLLATNAAEAASTAAMAAGLASARRICPIIASRWVSTKGYGKANTAYDSQFVNHSNRILPPSPLPLSPPTSYRGERMDQPSASPSRIEDKPRRYAYHANSHSKANTETTQSLPFSRALGADTELGHQVEQTMLPLSDYFLKPAEDARICEKARAWKALHGRPTQCRHDHARGKSADRLPWQAAALACGNALYRSSGHVSQGKRRMSEPPVQLAGGPRDCCFSTMLPRRMVARPCIAHSKTGLR